MLASIKYLLFGINLSAYINPRDATQHSDSLVESITNKLVIKDFFCRFADSTPTTNARYY